MKINSSSSWGMRTPLRSFSPHVPFSIVIHHVGAGEQPNIPIWKRNGTRVIESIERHHIDFKGWNAIGYHYIILPDGNIYEGRPDNVIGAHVGNNNTGRIGILVYGNFTYEHPTDEQKQALNELILHLKQKYTIDNKDVFYHGELVNTMCCGKNLAIYVSQKRLINWKAEEDQKVNTLVRRSMVMKLIDELKDAIKELTS